MATVGGVRPLPFATSPYARLGLAPGTSVSDIRRAYRRLVMRTHPDHAGDGSVEVFLAVKAAYEALLAQARLTMPEPSNRRTTWSGGRWYWEGLRANAAKRAR